MSNHDQVVTVKLDSNLQASCPIGHTFKPCVVVVCHCRSSHLFFFCNSCGGPEQFVGLGLHAGGREANSAKDSPP